MTDDLKVSRQRGGNHHPLPTRLFIIDYLTAQGETTILSQYCEKKPDRTVAGITTGLVMAVSRLKS